MKRNSLLWGFIDIALLILLANMLAGCVRTEYVPNPYPTQYVTVEDSPWEDCTGKDVCTAAETVCSWGNTPVVLVRKRFLADTNRAFIVAHESTHVEQMKRNCHAFEKQYQASRQFERKKEEEAYCAESNERIRQTHTQLAGINFFADMMLALYTAEKVQCHWISSKPP